MLLIYFYSILKARVLGVSEREEQSDARFGKKRFLHLLHNVGYYSKYDGYYSEYVSFDFITRLHIIKQKRVKGTCHIKMAMTNI